MGRMPKDLKKMMQQAQQMQAAMAEKQAEVSDKTYSGSAGGGVVTATVKGSGELVSVEFDAAALDPEDPELAGDLVVAAVNAAMAKANEDMSDALGGLTGGLDLGGLLG
ncbi:MAG: YbaB/EbfC family nucleoid-associated protein [Acidimicrobiia bacterium]|nr:YbaB/EbfC family nucleoid-associated protein [Acidimicrobiia bacterium]